MGGAIEDVRALETVWTTGRVIEKELPTPSTVRLRMHVEERHRHRPGQHYLIRLRAPDDYTAQRSYSVSSDDDDPLVEFLVEDSPGFWEAAGYHDRGDPWLEQRYQGD